jgi:hypothetical protein
MFKSELQECLKRIFDFKKVSFDIPGESQEQECLFVRVDKCNAHISDGKELARVEGELIAYANSDKLPHGYFLKAIDRAAAADVKKFFFHDIEASSVVTNNIVRRSTNFVFFYQAQYDPELGTITSVELQQSED